MTMKFYMTPGSCSTGIHILLEECGLIFEVTIVNLLAGDQYKAEYAAINPKGSIPALVLDDGTVLTEFSAIAWWLARSYPKRKLLPENLIDEVQTLSVMNHVVHTLHTQGFARIFTTERFAPSSSDHESVKAQGRQIIDKAFTIVDQNWSGDNTSSVISPLLMQRCFTWSSGLTASAFRSRRIVRRTIGAC